MLDFVFPNNNEQEFIKIASKLGYTKLCLIYDEKQIPALKETLKKLQEKTKIKLLLGVNLGNPPFKKTNADYAFLASSNNNQPALEQGKFDILYNAEQFAINHILCKLAKKNNISLGFSFSSILKARNKTKLIHNIKTHLMLCKKYNVKPIFTSFASDPFQMRSYYDLKSFFSMVTK